MSPRQDPADDPIGVRYGVRARQSLADLLSFGELAADLVARGKQAYDDDVALQLAGEAIQHRIGEAVSRLPEALIADNPQIRFRAMKGARNLVAHNYGIIDPEIVWNTLAAEFPRDLELIRSLGLDADD